jgi:signal transduction histidine kinase
VRRSTVALVPVAVVLALGAEWSAWDGNEPGLAVADLLVGWTLFGCGLVARERRPDSRVGALMLLSGGTWFLGTAFEAALFLHRGPLVHLHLSYPTGRVRTRLAQVVVAAAYVDAAFEPLARSDVLTLGLSGAVAVTAVQVFAGSTGPARKAGGPALAAALAFAGVLALGAVGRMAGWNDATILWVYDIVIATVVVGLLVDLLRGRWSDAVITGLVVDLGTTSETATLRAMLARALGDPALVVGYPLAGDGEVVDDEGRPVALPAPGSGRTVTPIDDGGERVAVLVHDEAVLADPGLVESVVSAARLAVANARLQAEARAQAVELEASRRRIVEASDAQRRRLEAELRHGVERRLGTLALLLIEAREGSSRDEGDVLARLKDELDDARAELKEFARGIHPPTLAEGGLGSALAALAEHSVVPVELHGEIGRLPDAVEAALYFVCSEALTNASKHARATLVTIEVRAEPKRVSVVVVDDGIGGASLAGGTGLRGLVDRVEALGGRLGVASPRGGGTRVVAELPLDR